MECTRDKWNCKEGGNGEQFQKMKVRVACLDINKIESEWKGIMV